MYGDREGRIGMILVWRLPHLAGASVDMTERTGSGLMITGRAVDVTVACWALLMGLPRFFGYNFTP